MKVGLFGTGAYGMALSSILSHNRCDVTMWTRFDEEKESLEKTRKNEKYLENFEIDKDIKITTKIEECINEQDLIIIAIPAAFVRSVCESMKPYVNNHHILIATKGIEQGTGMFMHEIVDKTLNTKNIAVISGPSFAVDIITKMPAGLTVASNSPETILIVRQALQNNYIKLDGLHDITGVEICGSIKNVIAIASGMLEGLKANDSTKAMLITEAMKDMGNYTRSI